MRWAMITLSLGYEYVTIFKGFSDKTNNVVKDSLRSALTLAKASLLLSVAKGGESCLTSGDRREPEDSNVYIKKPLPPRSAKPSEGEEEDKRVDRFLGFLSVTRG